LGEKGLLKVLARFSQSADPRLVVGFGDDTAVWDPVPLQQRKGKKAGSGAPPLLLATTDTMVEGTHFRLEWASWEDIGHKLVASNVSDVAAMGGRPTLALVSLACPPSTPMRSIRQLYSGMRKACDLWGAVLAGGDSVRADKVVLTLLLLGEKDRDTAPCLRSGVIPGQRIYVTGWPGESGAGLHLLLREGPEAGRVPRSGACPSTRPARWRRRLVDRHLRPIPRLRAGQELARQFPDLAMIDVSDGVDNELHLLAAASNVELSVSLETLPVSSHLRALQENGGRTDPRGFVLFGGEDFELLFATKADPDEVAKVLTAAAPALPVHEIGRVIEKRKGGRVVYHDPQGRSVAPPRAPKFEHFARRKS